MASRFGFGREQKLTTFSYLMMQALAELAVMYPVNGKLNLIIAALFRAPQVAGDVGMITIHLLSSTAEISI